MSNFYLSDQLVENVEKFCCLGSRVSLNVSLDEKISLRVGKAASTFRSLQKRVLTNR